MTQSQALDLLDMMREMVELQREMIQLQRKILEHLARPAPEVAVERWREWNCQSAPQPADLTITASGTRD